MSLSKWLVIGMFNCCCLSAMQDAGKRNGIDPRLEFLQRQISYLPAETQDIAKKLDRVFRGCGNYQIMLMHILCKNMADIVNNDLDAYLKEVGIITEQGTWVNEQTKNQMMEALINPHVHALIKYSFPAETDETSLPETSGYSLEEYSKLYQFLYQNSFDRKKFERYFKKQEMFNAYKE